MNLTKQTSLYHKIKNVYIYLHLLQCHFLVYLFTEHMICTYTFVGPSVNTDYGRL